MLWPPLTVASPPLTLRRLETEVGRDWRHYGGSRQKRLWGSSVCARRCNYHVSFKQERRHLQPPALNYFNLGGAKEAGSQEQEQEHLVHNSRTSLEGTSDCVYVGQTSGTFTAVLSIDDGSVRESHGMLRATWGERRGTCFKWELIKRRTVQ